MFYLSLAVLLVAAVGLTALIGRDSDAPAIPSLICISFTLLAIACLIAGMRGGATPEAQRIEHRALQAD